MGSRDNIKIGVRTPRFDVLVAVSVGIAAGAVRRAEDRQFMSRHVQVVPS
jgi:hypothetical protein